MNQNNLFNNNLLSKKRKELALSQEELAEKLDVSRQTIYAWESGKSIPDIKNIRKLCTLFNISFSDINIDFSDEDILQQPTSHTFNYKNLFFKIFLFIFLFIIFLFIIHGFKNFIFSRKINKYIQSFSNINNYYYKETHYTNNGMKISDFYIHETYFKDNILKISSESSIVWIDYNNNIGYTFDLNNNTYSSLILDDVLFPKNNGLKMISSSVLISNGFFSDFIYSFNPTFNIASKSNYYLVKSKFKRENFTLKTEEKIDKNSSLPVFKVETQNNGIQEVYTYDISINKTTNDDVSMPDLSLFDKK